MAHRTNASWRGPLLPASSRVLGLLLALLVTPGVVGCGKTSAPTAVSPAPDSLGTPIVAEGGINLGTSLGWSAATGEIVYTADDVSLRAVRPSTGATRMLEPGTADSVLLNYRMTRTGRFVYGTRSRFDGASFSYLVVRRDLVSGAVTTIDDRALDFRCGPSDTLVATWRENGGDDSTALVRPADGSTTWAGPGYPLAFSPDGSKLLRRGNGFTGTDGWIRRDLASGTEVPFAVVTPPGSRFLQVGWTPRGVQVVAGADSGRAIVVLDAATGTPLASFATRDTLFPGEVSWTSDGSRFACLTHHLEPNGAGSAFRMNTSLWIADLVSGRTARRFDAFDYSGPSLFSLQPSTIVLSPDDAWVAYPLGFALRQMRAQLP